MQFYEYASHGGMFNVTPTGKSSLMSNPLLTIILSPAFNNEIPQYFVTFFQHKGQTQMRQHH